VTTPQMQQVTPTINVTDLAKKIHSQDILHLVQKCFMKNLDSIANAPTLRRIEVAITKKPNKFSLECLSSIIPEPIRNLDTVLSSCKTVISSYDDIAKLEALRNTVTPFKSNDKNNVNPVSQKELHAFRYETSFDIIWALSKLDNVYMFVKEKEPKSESNSLKWISDKVRETGACWKYYKDKNNTDKKNVEAMVSMLNDTELQNKTVSEIYSCFKNVPTRVKLCISF
jgi:hypothetical protein